MSLNNKLSAIKKSRLFSAADIVLILLTAALVFCAAYFSTPRSKGSYAEIYSGNNLIKVMPLNTDDEFIYEYQGHYNKIIVISGKISVSESDCGDGICLNFAPTGTAGSTIICLPHQLMIIIRGEEEGIDGTVKFPPGESPRTCGNSRTGAEEGLKL